MYFPCFQEHWLYLHLTGDSENFLAWIFSLSASIHSERESGYLSQTFQICMFSFRHMKTNFSESQEIFLFCWEKCVLLEMRDHSVDEMVKTPHLKFECFVFVISSHETASEVVLHQIEDFSPIVVLTYAKAWFCLPSNEKFLPPGEWYWKASFSVSKTWDVFCNVSLSFCQRWRIMACYKHIFIVASPS